MTFLCRNTGKEWWQTGRVAGRCRAWPATAGGDQTRQGALPQQPRRKAEGGRCAARAEHGRDWREDCLFPLQSARRGPRRWRLSGIELGLGQWRRCAGRREKVREVRRGVRRRIVAEQGSRGRAAMASRTSTAARRSARLGARLGTAASSLGWSSGTTGTHPVVVSLPRSLLVHAHHVPVCRNRREAESDYMDG